MAQGSLYVADLRRIMKSFQRFLRNSEDVIFYTRDAELPSANAVGVLGSLYFVKLIMFNPP